LFFFRLRFYSHSSVEPITPAAPELAAPLEELIEIALLKCLKLTRVFHRSSNTAAEAWANVIASAQTGTKKEGLFSLPRSKRANSVEPVFLRSGNDSAPTFVKAASKSDHTKHRKSSTLSHSYPAGGSAALCPKRGHAGDVKLKEKVSKTLPNETGGVRGRKAEKTQVESSSPRSPGRSPSPLSRSPQSPAVDVFEMYLGSLS